MITLYDYLPSQNAWKIRALLQFLQTPYKQEFISIFEGEGKQPDFLSKNPTGAVPVIKLADGRTIAESNAILFYLAQNTPYLPDNPFDQSRVLQWLFFEADYVQASVATLRHWVLTGKDKNRSEELLSSKRAASYNVLSILEKNLIDKQYLNGDRFSIADLSVFAYVHLSADAGLELDKHPHLLRWIDDIRLQPRFLDTVYPYSIDQYSHREL